MMSRDEYPSGHFSIVDSMLGDVCRDARSGNAEWVLVERGGSTMYLLNCCEENLLIPFHYAHVVTWHDCDTIALGEYLAQWCEQVYKRRQQAVREWGEHMLSRVNGLHLLVCEYGVTGHMRWETQDLLAQCYYKGLARKGLE